MLEALLRALGRVLRNILRGGGIVTGRLHYERYWRRGYASVAMGSSAKRNPCRRNTPIVGETWHPIGAFTKAKACQLLKVGAVKTQQGGQFPSWATFDVLIETKPFRRRHLQ